MMGIFIGDSLFLCFTVLGGGLYIPSSGLLHQFLKLKTQRAESWGLRGTAERAPRNLVKRPFPNCMREMETGTENVYGLP